MTPHTAKKNVHVRVYDAAAANFISFYCIRTITLDSKISNFIYNKKDMIFWRNICLSKKFSAKIKRRLPMKVYLYL